MKLIKKLKNNKFQRSYFALKTISKAIPGMISNETTPERLLKSLMGNNIEKFLDEVGALKGSLLKAAQLISSYGEYYFPSELNEILRRVLSQNQYLSWEHIHKHIPDEFFNDLEIEETPIAAASIGQVHRAKILKTGEQIVLKIRYPGVKKAINTDIQILKFFINLSSLIPKNIDLSDIYSEVKKVLLQEMDYAQEIQTHIYYRESLKEIDLYYVPKVFEEYCCENIIASEYINSPSLSELNMSELSRDELNLIGESLLNLYFIEIFQGQYVQTDCHGGNFLLIRENSQFKLGLIDFGACLKYTEETLWNYRSLIKALYHKDKTQFFILLDKLIKKVDGQYSFDNEKVWDYCLLAISPLEHTSFDWGKTTLPDELYIKAKDILKSSSLSKPPHSFIFLDRKLIGIFSLLRQFGSVINMKEIADTYLFSD